MGWLTEAAFRAKKLLLFVVGLAMLAGAVSYFTMSSREDPFLTIRTASIVALHPGLPAERMEALVARPLEEAIISIPEIEEVRTTAIEGQVIIQVDAYFSVTDLDTTWDEVDEAVQGARPELPPTMGPILVNDDFGDVSVVTLALQSEDYSPAELHDYAQYIRDRLLSVDGTRRVSILGVPEETLYVRVDNAALQSAGLSTNDIRTALDARSVTLPTGEVILTERRYPLEVDGILRTADDISAVLINSDNPTVNRPVRLSEVARVEAGYADPPGRIAYYNGRPAIVLAIDQEVSASAINYGDRVLARIEEIRADLPIGVEMNTITVQKEKVEAAVYGVSRSVLQTLLVVSIVVVIFLGLRTGLVVGSIVPVVVLLTIAGMNVWGIPLQRMSLATIVIALGLLVDNGIVVAEDFKRRLGEGLDRREAVSKTGRELALPLLSSSLTTMIFFLPLALAQNDSSEYTRSISQVIVLSLGISWVIAMTVTPLLCFRFVKAPDENETKLGFVDRVFEKLENGYEALLGLLLRFRLLFVGAMVLAFMGGGWLMSTLPNQFFPSSDRAQILVYLDLPEGVSTVHTDGAMQTLLETVQNAERYPDVTDAAGYVGFGGPRFVLSLQPVDPGANVGFAVLNLSGLENIDVYVRRMQDELEETLPDALIRVSRMFLGPTDPNVVQIQVKGPDADHIVEVADRISDLLMVQDGFNYVWTNWLNPSAKLVVDVDETRAKLAGLSRLDIAQQVSVLTAGQTATHVYQGDEKIPVVIRAVDAQSRSVDYLQSLALYAPGSSDPIRLGSVADIRLQGQYARINREDLERTVTIEGSNVKTSPEDLVVLLREDLDAIRQGLQPGHVIEFDGAVGDSGESQGALAAQAPLALGLILVLLLAQFGSFRNLAIILLILPLSVIGAAIGLKVMSAPFGFMVILGLFALFGIVVNNAIVLIDRIEIEMKAADDEEEDDKDAEGDDYESRQAALISASKRRLRPILITTITTILGLLPLIIGRDVLFYGLANVVAFGLAVGTILTLGVVPVLYSLFFGIGKAHDGKDVS
ncbi:MAG: efflux RND transporter permease subunit [Litorimonas sp.]